jgi:hypothetical protein
MFANGLSIGVYKAHRGVRQACRGFTGTGLPYCLSHQSEPIITVQTIAAKKIATYP